MLSESDDWSIETSFSIMGSIAFRGRKGLFMDLSTLDVVLLGIGNWV
jgi:hypothetical protein